MSDFSVNEDDIISQAESVVTGILGKVYNQSGQALLDLSEKGKIETKEEKELAMIAVRTLISYFAFSSEFDASNFCLTDDTLDYSKITLPCGKKIEDCKILSRENCKS